MSLSKSDRGKIKTEAKKRWRIERTNMKKGNKSLRRTRCRFGGWWFVHDVDDNECGSNDRQVRLTLKSEYEI